ncbi:MAG TPA: hypothetical protein VFN23_11590 [Ktedonobacteraceae bacterium]|nr:hypothetical protein [Ktedonobacteraceae bacterium]
MHFYLTQELARHHQETLVHEAKIERLLRPTRKQRLEEAVPLAAALPASLVEPDYRAIRGDLSSTLSEWHLESGAESFETMIDTFMHRLKTRLEPAEACRETSSFR